MAEILTPEQREVIVENRRSHMNYAAETAKWRNNTLFALNGAALIALSPLTKDNPDIAETLVIFVAGALAAFVSVICEGESSDLMQNWYGKRLLGQRDDKIENKAKVQVKVARSLSGIALIIFMIGTGLAALMMGGLIGPGPKPDGERLVILERASPETTDSSQPRVLRYEVKSLL